MFNEMRVHTTSFVLHPKGMSSAPESRNLIFLPSLSLRPFFTDSPSLYLSDGGSEAGNNSSCVVRRQRRNALCAKECHTQSVVRPSAAICVHTLLHIARGRRGGGYAWDGHDFFSISALQKRLICGKLCESLIAEERHATNSHLPAHAQQDAKEPNV